MDEPADTSKEQSRRDAAKLARQVEANDIKWLMGNKQGRRIVWRLLARAGVYRTSFAGVDAQTNFNEGARNNGLLLLADVNTHAPDAFAVMAAESRIKDQ